jgi:acetyl esterase/lipase
MTAPLAYDAEPLKESAEMDDWTKAFLASGYTVFLINHRATPRFTYPVALEDAQRAVRFVRANASIFKIAPDKIGGFGGSSVGYLVSMLGVLDEKGDPKDHDRINRVSSKVQSVVALYASLDLRRMQGNAAVALFIGVLINPTLPEGALRTEYACFAEASPITHVTPDDSPFLLFHGDVDPVVPIEQSRVMDVALKKAGIPVTCVPVSGGSHGRNFQLSATDSRLTNYFAQAAQWFDAYLRAKCIRGISSGTDDQRRLVGSCRLSAHRAGRPNVTARLGASQGRTRGRDGPEGSTRHRRGGRATVDRELRRTRLYRAHEQRVPMEEQCPHRFCDGRL